jgi:hypothetical protein
MSDKSAFFDRPCPRWPNSHRAKAGIVRGRWQEGQSEYARQSQDAPRALWSCFVSSDKPPYGDKSIRVLALMLKQKPSASARSNRELRVADGECRAGAKKGRGEKGSAARFSLVAESVWRRLNVLSRQSISKAFSGTLPRVVPLSLRTLQRDLR